MAERRRFAVVGDPVQHSLSPRIFAWLREHAGFPADYVAWQVPEGQMARAARAVRDGEYQGLSVTLPHKEAALALVDEAEPLARAVGAVNCLLRTADGRLKGANTDVPGLSLALARHGVRLAGAQVVLLGAGGAARAAVAALTGAASLVVANRTPERARRVVEALCPAARVVPLTAEALGPALEQATLLVNATRVGLEAPLDSPLPDGLSLHPRLTVLDMVYRPLRTRLLAEASAAGARTVDGLWMLVLQALEQLRLWTGRAAPEEVAGRLYQHLLQELT